MQHVLLLHGRASMLRYTNITCLANLYFVQLYELCVFQKYCKKEQYMELYRIHELFKCLFYNKVF